MAYLPSFTKATSLVSPAARYSNDSSVTASSGMQGLDCQTPSPTKKAKAWLQASNPTNELNLHKVKGSKITKASRTQPKRRSSFWGLSLLANLFGKNQTSEVDDLEGDTVIDQDTPIATIEDDNDFTLVVNEDDYYDDVKLEKTERTLQDYHSDRPLDHKSGFNEGWTEDENWFFIRLRSRGREPLFDQTWAMDFPNYPDILFTKDPRQVFINSTNCNLYRAIRAFDDLSRSGGHVQAQIAGGAVPEKPLYRAINAYYKWTLADGKLEHKAHIPVTAIACAKPQETTESVVGRLTDQLHDLGRRYRNKWRHPDCAESDEEQSYTHSLPTLFGFVIKYTVVAIVTCDSSIPGCPIRTLHTGDWKVIGQNVWHAIAVATAFVRQRNYLMGLDEEEELGPEVVEVGDDPDI